MSWAEHHKRSERLASEAQLALLQDKRNEALALYARAADAEVEALAVLDRSKARTTGISAVSAASLYCKAANLERAEEVAAHWLGVHALPDFAKTQLRGILQTIWAQRACIGSQFEGNLVRAEAAIAEIRQLYEVARQTGALD